MKKVALSLTALLLVVGAAVAGPVIRHAKVSTKPASADPSQIGGPDWNADHVIDTTALLSAEGITIVSGNPNGTTGTLGQLAWDQLDAQLYINTDGSTTWTAFVRSDGGTAPARLAFTLDTDSNGVVLGSESDMDDPNDAVATPNTNVQWISMYSLNFSEPVTPVNMGTGFLRNKGFSPDHGPELQIGKNLNDVINGFGSTPDAHHQIWLDQFSLSSSKLSDWTQSSTSGTLSPLLGGGNLDADMNARWTALKGVSGREIAGAFIQLGTNDTSDGTAAAAVGTNATAFVTRRRALFGNQLAIVWVVPQPTIPQPNTATVITNLTTALGGTPGLTLVRADDIPTGDDQVHYTAFGASILGTRMAFAMSRLLGLREVTVSVPTVVGASQATYNGSIHGLSGITGAPGANLRAFTWQGGKDGDVMFMPVFTGAIGAGSTIPTPSGWTAAATQISDVDGAGVGNQVALFTKQVQQVDLDGNGVSSGGPGFPATLTITPGGLQMVTKPFTVRGAGRFPAIDGSVTSFTHSARDTAAVSAGGVTTTAPNRTVFIEVVGWGGISESFTVANSNLSNLTQVFGAAYPSNSGNYLFVGLWTGTKATAGATGTTTVTPAVASSSYGFTWAM